jgi:hypothetical protein
MMHEHYILISRLKQQPRQGQTNDPNRYKAITEFEKFKLELEADAKAIGQSLDGLAGEIQNKFTAIFQSLTDESLSLQLGIGKLANVFDETTKSATALVQQATWLEQRNKNLNKSFRINSAEAAKLGQSYDKIATSLQTGGEQVRKYAQNVDKMLPGMAKMITSNEKFRNQLFMTNALLTDHLQLTEEQASGYQMYAAGVGQSSLDMLGATQQFTEQLEKATGLSGQFAATIEGVSNLTADIQMQYRKMPGNLEMAVIKAKVLGMTFDKIEAAATKMLDIESSVNDELNYQLISGKRLVDQDGESITQKLRMAKLTGDANAQTEAMNELLETQSDVLDSNNFYAKEQLAQLTGFSQAELMRAHQTKKLIGAGFDKDKIDDILKMKPEDFAETAKTMNKDQTALFEKIRAAETQKTTDQLANDFYQRERTEGIRVIAGDQFAAITKSAEAILGASKTGGTGTFVQASADMAKTGFNKPMVDMLGTTQLMGGAANIVTKQLSTLGETIPLVGGKIKEFGNKITAVTNKIFGSTPTATTGVTSVNDAIIKFNPQDKIMVASTDPGQLMPAVNQLTGGSNTTAVDPRPIAAAVASAIQSAMSGMKIEMDGYNLAKAMEFSNRTLNG